MLGRCTAILVTLTVFLALKVIQDPGGSTI